MCCSEALELGLSVGALDVYELAVVGYLVIVFLRVRTELDKRRSCTMKDELIEVFDSRHLHQSIAEVSRDRF